MSNYTSSRPDDSNSEPNLEALKNWKQYTLQDAFRPRDPIKYIVNNLFELPSLNIVFGSPGSLKSFLLADLACCVAAGRNWLTHQDSNTANGWRVTMAPVLWLDFDNGTRRTHERFSALARARGIPASTALIYESMPSPILNMRDEKHVAELITIIKSCGARLVIIDNLGVISGGADENTSEMIEILLNLRRVAETTESAVVVIHHPRKSSAENGKQGDTLRGHSSILASLDLALHIDRELDSPIITIKPVKERGKGVMSFSARFTYEDDPDGQLISACFFADSKLPLTSVDTINRAIIDCLGGDTLNKTTLCERVHEKLSGEIGINRIGSNINYLAEQGYLTMKKGENNAQLYSCNPTKPY